LKLQRGWLLQVAILALADLFIGYLAVEAFNAFSGARFALPASRYLVDSLALSPLFAGAILGLVLAGFCGAYVFWLWRYTPDVLTRYLRPKAKVASAKKNQGMRVEDLQLAESPETKPFVDVVQLEGFPLNIYSAVTKEEDREGYTYTVIEPSLSAEEKKRLEDIRRLLVDELDVDLRAIETPEKAEAYLSDKVRELARKYAYRIPPGTMTKFLYYIARDYIHLGKIEPLMRDKLIEDISCDGAGIPIYIWYRDYESIPTNIVFETEDELDTYVSKLAYMTGKHVSLAEPIVDASLGDGSRIHLTYGKEVTQRGSTFTIRKFRVDPLTVVDLIQSNTLSSDVAAYLWYLIEKKLALLVAGGTASGKSIPHDEKVLVHRDGRPQLVEIGALYDELAASKQALREGVHDVIPCEGMTVSAFDSNLKVDLHDVKSIVRHSAPEKLFRVRTRSGRTVEATGDHSVFTLVDGRVKPFSTSALSPGMSVAVPRRIPDREVAPRTIDLLEALRGSKRGLCVENISAYVKAAVEILGEEEAARVLGMTRRSMREGLRRGFLVSSLDGFMGLVSAAGIPVDPEGYWIRSKAQKSFRVQASLRVSKPLARLLGYWAAEGVHQEDGPSLSRLDPKTRADMIDSALSAFGPRENGQRARLDLHSSVLSSLMDWAFKGGKSIPEFIWQEDNEILAEFLRAYFTRCGYISDAVEASTRSEESASQLQYALSRFGIVARVAPKVVNGLAYHRVSILGQQDLRKFEAKIGFLDDRRRESLRTAISAHVQPHTGLDTIPGVAPPLKEALSSTHGREDRQSWEGMHPHWSPTRNSAGSGTLVSLIEEMRPQDSVEQRLSTPAYSDIFWDQVVAVEEFDYEGDYVYDLEVPGVQNFIGGSGGIFLHNTTLLNALSMFIEPGQKVVSVEDSVTRDAEILISERGRVRKCRIGDFIDSKLTPSPERTSQGRELARVTDLEVLTCDDTGKTLWSPCTALIRHKVSKEFVKVRTLSGNVIEVTADHSLFSVAEDGLVDTIRAGSLTLGSYIAAPRSYPDDGLLFEPSSAEVDPGLRATVGGTGTKATSVGGSQLAIFADEAESEQPEMMGELLEGPKTKYLIDPIPLNELLIQELRVAMRELRHDAVRRRIDTGIGSRVISRQTLLELGDHVSEYRGSKGFALAEGGHRFELVVKAEKSHREEYVYDLSVPGTGRFIANDLVCHNTAELNLPHENWIQSVTRGVGTPGEITMFDLLKASLRQRPDVIIVGEVRGEEAYTLMQSVSTGHGGLGTIHADSVEGVINRLTTEPMNIPRSLVGSTLDCIVMQLKIRLADKSVRRVTSVTEVVGHDARTDEIVLNDAFKWDPVMDKFSFTGRSKLFDKITLRFGTRPEEIRRDIEGRRLFLDWLVAKNIRGHTEVSNQVREFYASPHAVINKAKAELEGLKA
jgi:type IV secretory pathway ATPase VirB11/archaellum biosynthesis ATPase/intein/homing endonuclease